MPNTLNLNLSVLGMPEFKKALDKMQEQLIALAPLLTEKSYADLSYAYTVPVTNTAQPETFVDNSSGSGVPLDVPGTSAIGGIVSDFWDFGDFDHQVYLSAPPCIACARRRIAHANRRLAHSRRRAAPPLPSGRAIDLKGETI